MNDHEMRRLLREVMEEVEGRPHACEGCDSNPQRRGVRVALSVALAAGSTLGLAACPRPATDPPRATPTTRESPPADASVGTAPSPPGPPPDRRLDPGPQPEYGAPAPPPVRRPVRPPDPEPQPEYGVPKL